MVLRAGRVRIEGLPGVYPAMLEEGTWNGAAIPWFTAETALSIMADWRTMGPDYLARAVGFEGDPLAFEFDSLELWEEPDVFVAQVVDGTVLYPIGAAAWTWEEV